MWFDIVNWFTKITAWPIQKICFRTKILYEDKNVQDNKIQGSAILVSNHTSVFDYAVFLFVFFGRTLRYQMAEVLFQKKLLGFFLRQMGGIFVNRNSTDLSFLYKSADILKSGGIVGVFPEGRIPSVSEEKPLKFQSGAAFLSLETNTPVIPIYTNGSYFSKKRCFVVIGKPIYPSVVDDKNISDKEKIELFCNVMRDKIIELGNIYEKQKH